MLHSLRIIGLQTLLVVASSQAATQTFPFVIPSDDQLPTITDQSRLLEGPIEANSDRVEARDGHFYRSHRRVRFWGVNFCFGACFPSHAQAEQIAGHLAKLGVNAVRFHHLDMLDAPNGIWQPLGDDGVRHFDAEMVDRLDYFLAQLHQQGIYANLNLQVSRTLTPQEGFPLVEDAPWWAAFNKWTTYFHPGVQHELKRYSYMLLMHRNPYRQGTRRIDDAGIALVELMNENFFSEQGTDLVGDLPEFYRAPLIERWNQWLSSKYDNEQNLVDAWTKPPIDGSLSSGNVPLPVDGSPDNARNDLTEFLVETELSWARDFKRFLRDLGLTVPITVSQVGFSHSRVTDEVSDYVDAHHYWHHPIFAEGGDWDPDHWTVGNDPLEANPFREGWPTTSLLTRLSARRFDKPFILSEWNYPEPSHYAVGCVPLAATLAALQDWDGVFFFEYDSEGYSSDPDAHLRDHSTNFFAFNGQPLKLAALSLSANLFLRGDLERLPKSRLVDGQDTRSSAFGLTYRLGRAATSRDASPLTPDQSHQMVSPNRSVRWTWTNEEEGRIDVQTSKTIASWGTIGGSSVRLNEIQLDVGPVQPNYGIVMLSAVDDASIDEASTILLFAAAHVENVGMQWNDARTSVGRQWGQGPSQVTGLTVKLQMPLGATFRCFALNELGQRKSEVRLQQVGEFTELLIEPTQQTIWYELKRLD